MDNYDIRYDDKYGQATHIDLVAEGAAHDPWVNQTLTILNDSVVRFAVIDGRLVDWHKHEREDELGAATQALHPAADFTAAPDGPLFLVRVIARCGRTVGNPGRRLLRTLTR